MSQLFNVSDQLVSYLTEANYGNGLAYLFKDPATIKANGHDEKVRVEILKSVGGPNKLLQLLQNYENTAAAAEGRQPGEVTPDMVDSLDVQRSLDLILSRRIASSRLLISLFILISEVNGLLSKTDPQRIHYDINMLKWFGADTNTRWLLNGTDLTPVSQTGVPADVKNVDKFVGRLADVNKSAFERLTDHTVKTMRDKKEIPLMIPYDAEVYSENKDDWGLLHSGYLHLISYCRIPVEVLTLQQRAELITAENIGLEGEVNGYIQQLLQTQRTVASKRPAIKHKSTGKK
jgi:hypothetical protein